MKNKITKSSTAEYFAKNLQQVGFSSLSKAVLTTVKEAVDNSLDACEEAGILPEIFISVQKKGEGSSSRADLIEVYVQDNGPGLEEGQLTAVFGEYLASSKFGRGRCSRGQQGIGISAATTWAQLTHASGVEVVSKTASMKKAIKATVHVSIKENKGVLKDKRSESASFKHGLSARFLFDGRVQLNGDGGLLTYLEGVSLLNPHLTLSYKLMDNEPVTFERLTHELPEVPPSMLPHPHTMKLGEFLTHAHLYGAISLSKFLRTGFSRVSDKAISEFVKSGLPRPLLKKSLTTLDESDYKKIFQAVQKTSLMSPATASVLIVGEEALSKSIKRLGEVDFFGVVTRKPCICDFKPVVVEVALARLQDANQEQRESSVRLLRFANRVPLQFDKSSCAITKAVESVNWKSYGLSQSKKSLPTGPYVFAVSVTSPFVKFKNASKETIDASDDLVSEIRLALIQAGQKLSRHIKKEMKAADLQRKVQYVQKFGPILIETLVRMTSATDAKKKKAQKGLDAILGQDTNALEHSLQEAENRLEKMQVSAEKKGQELAVSKKEPVKKAVAKKNSAKKSSAKKKTTKRKK